MKKRNKKSCPVCGSTTWNYDVVEYSSGVTFCGDCMFEVRRAGKEMGLMKWDGCGLVFANSKDFCKALNTVKKSA